MRKKSYFNICERDIKAFQLFRSCHHATEKQLQAYNISKNRMNSYMKQKIIEKRHFLNNKKETQVVYELTKKGREWLKKNVSGMREQNFYTSKTSVQHNLKMADIYLSKPDVQVWYTERDIKEQYLQVLLEQGRWAEIEEITRTVSVPDMACISSTGEIIYMEVITENYPESLIDSKIEFAKQMGIDIEFYRC